MGQLNPLLSQAMLPYTSDLDPRSNEVIKTWHPQGNDYERPNGDFLSKPTNAVQASDVESDSPITDQEVESAFNDKLSEYGYKNIRVQADTSNPYGIVVHFSDDHGDNVIVLFSVGNDDYPYADLIHKDPGSRLSIDLSTVHPRLVQYKDNHKVVIDLADLDWMNKTTLATILSAGHVSYATELAGHNVEESLRYKRAIILGGQVIKLPIVTSCNMHPEDYNSVIDHIETTTGWPVPTSSSSKFHDRAVSRGEENNG